MKTGIKNKSALLNFSSFKQMAELENQNGLHQQVLLEFFKSLKTKQDVIELATRLVTLAEHNYSHRRLEVVESISQALINLPLPEAFKQVGEYHLAMCVKRQGRFDEAQKQLEALADNIRHRYKSRAVLSLAYMANEKGDLQSTLPLYVEASRLAGSQEFNDPSVKIVAQRTIAIIKSEDGDHEGALADLNRLFPIVRAVSRWDPSLLYDHLNSLAVELAEVNRLEEAGRAAGTAVASPYAHAYPQWRETLDEIRVKSQRASRSSVLNIQLQAAADNVVHLPCARPADNNGSPQSFSPRPQQARVINFEEWSKMFKEDDTPQQKPARLHGHQMTLSEKQAKLLRLIYDDNVSEEFLDKLLKTAEDVELNKQASS